MSSLQVRRPEDVGTPDSEAKGRNHPLYFVGTPRDSLLILMRRVMRNMMRHAMRDCVRTKRNTTRAGAWSMLFLPQPFTGLHKSRTTFTMNHQGERGAWQWLSRATSASYLNRQPSAIVIPHEQVTRKCKIMQICSYYVHFYSLCPSGIWYKPASWSRHICQTFTTLLPWMQIPSRVCQKPMGSQWMQPCTDCFSLPHLIRDVLTLKTLRHRIREVVRQRYAGRSASSET